MKPYNTIDLRDSNNNRVKEKDDSKKIIQPVSRNEYKKIQKIGDKLLKEMEEHAKSGKPLIQVITMKIYGKFRWYWL